MISFKAQMVNFLLKHRRILQGQLKKQVFTMESSITDFRDQCEKSAARLAKTAEGVAFKQESIEGINCEWLIPQGAPEDKVIFYVHGGGYVSGCCRDHRGFISKYARQNGVTTLIYDYRLAPEHPYPAALEDSVKVYTGLLSKGYEAENILISGESAGGGLALSLTLYLRDHKISLPTAVVVMSPWTDLVCTGESYSSKNKYSLAPLNTWFVFGKHYFGDQDPHNPYISPLYGDLQDLPPLYINSGEYDELYDDGRLFAEKAKKAGNEVIFVSGEKMVHCYPLLSPMFPEAKQAMDHICEYITKKLKLEVKNGNE